uniref:HECT domain-containing protein n=1 Tax=Cyprinus carpio TaxID=7962 RepID=A0A8C1KLJ3_CYPCA
MEGVEGWLFYKASGGHGRRKLLAIPPDVDGYTGRLIRSVLSAGKTTMYIVPLQQDLDLTPLPSDATEFQKMPKAACQVCKENMPLHILALHIENCMESAADDDERPGAIDLNICCLQDRKECPICCGCFPSDEIVLHASLDFFGLLFNSDDDVLQWLASQVDASKDFKICITRDNLFQRGLIQWQRQKKGSPVNKLNVTFIGEAGIDTGALSKEFLTEMMHGIERRLFEGSGKGKSPVYSICDLENGFYRTAGEVFSVSLAQGGPAPCFFRNWCYQFLTTGDFDALQLTKDDVDDLEYALLIERVTTDLTQFTDEIVSCGYTGLLKLDQKDSIIRAIVLHATMRLTPMLQQIRNGMKVYNLLDVIGKHQTLCSNLFVPKKDDDRPDADYIMSIIVPELSEKGSPRQARENAIINFLQDFLQDLEITEHWSQQTHVSLSVPTVMQWLTGQRHKPLLPSERADFKINLRYEH